MMKALSGLFALSVALGATPALSQTKWDLPAAYAATNFHSENLIQFAKDVDQATAGKFASGGLVHVFGKLNQVFRVKVGGGIGCRQIPLGLGQGGCGAQGHRQGKQAGQCFHHGGGP